MLQHRDDSATTVAEGTPPAGANACASVGADSLPAALLALLSPWRLVLDQLLLMAEPLCTPLQREPLRRYRAWLKDAPAQPSGRVTSSCPAHDRQGHNAPEKGTL